ncbi:cytochrome c oxidase subunit 2 [Dictyobacter alpinus]|uniref:Cytochrome c oxidase subunit 2 n=1 Tax=Dictyobacter alpinus TaxID=2014873 RepID=A0A402B3I2_9CHLR|nr:cytochrome c oxidase subunit II [Dictyobacter alpinus]GCE25911.1 cytochrome c oxidase subunit 2 [Dictyobacter alpinus]
MALLGCLLLSSILFAACGENSPSILNTAGPVAESESGLFWIILWIAVVIFILVEGILIYSIARYRERPGMPNPFQRHGNMTLELIWTVIPTLVLFVILFFTIRGLLEVAPENEPAATAAQPRMAVTAVGHQWWWEFHYPNYNVTTADVLEVPVGTTISVDLFSNNVIHSFWVPALTGKTDLVPGHDNKKWFVADKEGTYMGICAEYCGTQHANMRFEVKVVSKDAFKSWMSTQQQAAATPNEDLAKKGEDLFKNQCASCHGIVGVNVKQYYDTKAQCTDAPGGKANGTPECLIGPNLTHFGSRNLIAGGVLDNNTAQCDPNNPNLLKDCNLAKWLKDPQGIKPGNDMAIGALTNEQIQQLVAYLEGLK